MQNLILFLLCACAAALAAGCQTTKAPQTANLTSTEEAAADEEAVEVATKETKAVSDPDYDPNEVICKPVKRSGSRLGREKDCRTAEQWRDTMTNATRGINDMRDSHSGHGLSQ